jgi:hypothetical protein
MEIYIRTRSRDSGRIAWWNHNDGESYLFDSKSLWAKSQYTDDSFLAGTAFKSYKQLKHEAREAKRLAEFDGDVDVEVTFWKLNRNGCPMQVKFTRDGKMKA